MSYDRLKQALFDAVEALFGPRIDRCALYPGRVISRTGGGPGGDQYQLEVQLDDQRWPSLTKVPLRPPIPGARVAPVPGSRVLVGWEEARAEKPYALPIWGDSDKPETIIIDAALSIRISAPSIEIDGTTALALSGGGQPIARLGDTVTAGPYAGTITGGSTKVTSG